MTPTTLPHRATAGLGLTLLVLGLAACGSADDPVGDRATDPTQATSAADELAGAAESDTSVGAEESDESVGAEESDEPAGAEESDTSAGAEEDEGSDGGVIGSTDAPVEPSADVESARAGLARYLEANMPPTPQTSTNIPGCPAIDQHVLEEALGGVGYPGTVLRGWSTEIEWDEYDGIGQDVIGIVCGGDSDGSPNDSDFGVAAGIVAVDLKGKGAAPEDIFGDAERAPGPSDLGGEIASMCEDDTFCFAAWISDDFLLGTVLNTEGATEGNARALLDSTLPRIVVTLASDDGDRR